MERLAYRLYHVLGDIAKRVDLETYGLFKAIVLKEGKEWVEDVSDMSRNAQTVVQDLSKEFFEVLSFLSPN